MFEFPYQVLPEAVRPFDELFLHLWVLAGGQVHHDFVKLSNKTHTEKAHSCLRSCGHWPESTRVQAIRQSDNSATVELTNITETKLCLSLLRTWTLVS